MEQFEMVEKLKTKAGVTAAQRIQAIMIAGCCMAALFILNKSQLARSR